MTSSLCSYGTLEWPFIGFRPKNHFIHKPHPCKDLQRLSPRVRLFQILAMALFLVVLACGVGFMEAKNPVARTLFAGGFGAAFGVAAVGIVWFRDKLT